MFGRCHTWVAKFDLFNLAFFSILFLGSLFVSPAVFGLRFESQSGKELVLDLKICSSLLH
jgi:hypothetical protein